MTQKGVEFETINYLDEPLTTEALKRLLRSAGLKASEAVRSNEPAYREFVAGRNLSDDELVRLMAEHPQLIQRPIVVRGGKADSAPDCSTRRQSGTRPPHGAA